MKSLELCLFLSILWGFLGSLAGKESACNAGDIGDKGLIPDLGRSLEKEMYPEFILFILHFTK